MPDPNVIKVTAPSPIAGNSTSSVFCPNGTGCGSGSPQEECSGTYGCPEVNSILGSSPSVRDSVWYPVSAPLPDNLQNVPQKCNIPSKNIGRYNFDPIKPLTNNQLSRQITGPWTVQANFTPQKPLIVKPIV